MSSFIIKFKSLYKQLIFLSVALIPFSQLNAAHITIPNVTVTSVKLSGMSVFLKGNNIPASCSGTQLMVTLDETLDPGGKAIYSTILTAEATGQTLTINYDDAQGSGNPCTIRWIELG